MDQEAVQDRAASAFAVGLIVAVVGVLVAVNATGMAAVFGWATAGVGGALVNAGTIGYVLAAPSKRR